MGYAMGMKVTHTSRGFEIIENQGCCKVQQSSAIGEYEDSFEKPGSSFLWFGEEHLTREQVSDYLKHDLIPEPLVEHCKAWLETGSLIIK